MIGKVGAKCPENRKQIPLISKEGSACVSCGLCIHNKSDIVFSAKKKQEVDERVMDMACISIYLTIHAPIM